MNSQTSIAPANGNALGWGVFLGMSWTWCIGMFLPVLLVREMGLWGWVVFAVPNVLGAAAMGWLLRDRAASVRMVENNVTAGVAFSAVTIAFHIFFAFWIIRALVGGGGVMITFALAGIFWLLMRRSNRIALALAIVVFLFSLLMIFQGWGFLDKPHFAALSRTPSRDALFLAPVCVLGFALCPYLDLTFHRARQETTPAGGKVAFTLGFGLFFLLMIIFTLAYARYLAPITRPGGELIRTPLAVAIAMHMAVQSGFTIAAHARELTVRFRREEFPAAMFTAIMTIGLAMAGALVAQRGQTLLNFTAGEVVYRLFMSFYGLVFPAYALVFLFWRTPGQPRPILLLATTILAAAPFYALGFLRGQMIYLVSGAFLVLLGGLMSRAAVARAKLAATASGS